MTNKYTAQDLKEMQQWSLERKIQVTQTRIIEWFKYWRLTNCCVSFSGGIDSTVLLDITSRVWSNYSLFDKLIVMFVDTGLEYPEIKKFVKDFCKWCEEKYEIEIDLWILYPNMNFKDVITKYGYPIISKEISGAIDDVRKLINNPNWDGIPNSRMNQFYNSNSKFYDRSQYKFLFDAPFKISNKCCDVMKKRPSHKFKKKPILGTMATDSLLRRNAWYKTGCNLFDSRTPVSKPMSFWNKQDVLTYIKEFSIPYCSVYGDVIESKNKLCTTGCNRTGCVYCGYYAEHEKESDSRFLMLKQSHPKQYEYCISGGEFVDGLWQPSKDGLGLKFVFDWLNEKFTENSLNRHIYY